MLVDISRGRLRRRGISGDAQWLIEIILNEWARLGQY